MWADRITASALSEQLVREQRADARRAGRGRGRLARLGRPPRRLDLDPARRAGRPGQLTRRSSSRASRERMSSRAARIGADSPLKVSVSRA